MSEKGTDRRVLRTKRAIRTAYAHLLAEKGIDKISVSDIAELADVNRKTFYNYYDGIYQLRDELENEIVDSFNRLLGDTNLLAAWENPYPVFEKLSRAINADMDLFELLLIDGTRSGLNEKLTEVLIEKTERMLKNGTAQKKAQVHYVCTYLVSGMLAVYQAWFNSDRSVSIQEISSLLGEAAFHGVSKLLPRIASNF